MEQERKWLQLARITDQYLASHGLDRLAVPYEDLQREFADMNRESYLYSAFPLLKENVQQWAEHLIRATSSRPRIFAATLYLYHLEILVFAYDKLNGQ